jgi:DNA-binding response OmpR family regulator
MARLSPSHPSWDKSEGGRAAQELTRPGIGITLLILDSSMDIAGVVGTLRGRGLRSAVTPLAQNVMDILSGWKPRAAILQAGLPDWLALLRFLKNREVPVVLLGTAEQIARAERESAASVHLLMPAEPVEIAEATELVIGPVFASGLPESIDLGIVKIGIRNRTTEIEGEAVELPPKEFDLLVELALRPGEPIESSELLRRLWPGSTSATVDDVHSRVFRLRRFIGDHDRAEPLITTRRGYGYLLNLVPVKVD